MELAKEKGTKMHAYDIHISYFQPEDHEDERQFKTLYGCKGTDADDAFRKAACTFQCAQAIAGNRIISVHMVSYEQIIYRGQRR